ncbi:MAG: DNA polymerase IV [Lachnospiraceae bacterium]|nr:DNA polymerase IV [Lachnospiraceae bacterium]
MPVSIVFHIDVNSAFLSWTALELLRKDPASVDLRTIPAIIGGDEKQRHGVVLAKSIPAKRYGIHTGEPVATALRKCPFLKLVPPDHALYRTRSRELMTLLHTYTSDIEQVSIDECYLFYTPISHRFPSPEAAARQIADEVKHTLGFTVNVGIAENKLLAKMASDFEKPDRVHTLYRDEIPSKMWPLSVHELFMVGRRSASRLEELGIHTIGELAHSDRAFLQTQFKSHGILMWEYANGIDHSAVHADATKAKCIGNSTTLASDVTTRSAAFEVLLSLSEEVAARLRKAGQLASTVTVEVKYSDFHTASRQMQTRTPIATTDALYDCACQLFNALWNGSPIRLLGVRTSRLQSEHDPIQLSLFDLDIPLTEASPSDAPSASDAIAKKTDLEKQRKLDAAMDQIRQKFGKDAVMRGSHLPRPKSPIFPLDT